jgi:hypothetical protein
LVFVSILPLKIAFVLFRNLLVLRTDDQIPESMPIRKSLRTGKSSLSNLLAALHTVIAVIDRYLFTIRPAGFTAVIGTCGNTYPDNRCNECYAEYANDRLHAASR